MKRTKFKSWSVQQAAEFIRRCRAMKERERAERERAEDDRLIEQALLADGGNLTPGYMGQQGGEVAFTGTAVQGAVAYTSTPVQGGVASMSDTRTPPAGQGEGGMKSCLGKKPETVR